MVFRAGDKSLDAICWDLNPYLLSVDHIKVQTLNDQAYMKETLHLARRGLGWVSPNPMVGALVVQHGTIIGRGYHQRFGGPHAEVRALKAAKENPAGAVLYVNLEPCCHFGKTPPCVDFIISREIRRVVIGIPDPNPLVAGRGIRALRDRGIEVTVGVLEEACRTLNEAYLKYHETGVPFVTLKMAQSLDGRIATKTGSSQWISSLASLKLAHRWRATHDAVMVGVNTVLRDDPSLTVRLVKGRSPRRVIVDSTLRIPMKKRVLVDGGISNTTVLTTGKADPQRIKKIHAQGGRVWRIKANSRGEVDLDSALRTLAHDGVTSLLIEGGATLATAFLQAGMVDKLLVVIGGKIIGSGIDAVGDLGITDVNQALRISIEKTQKVGEDLVVVARMNA